MFKTTLVHKVLAAVAGCTFSLAVGVSVGAVPLPGVDTEFASAPAPAIQPGVTDQVLVSAQFAPPTTMATAAAPSLAVPATAPKVTTPPSTRAPRPAPTVPAAAPAPAIPAPVVPPPVALVAASRRTPSGTEVQAAISGLVQRVGGLLKRVPPTAEQIAQAGDQMCTAFDNGKTFAEVKATGLAMIPSFVKVTPATADWAVRTAVSMYCPDHTSKLV